jgi:hypothetical protein
MVVISCEILISRRMHDEGNFVALGDSPDSHSSALNPHRSKAKLCYF